MNTKAYTAGYYAAKIGVHTNPYVGGDEYRQWQQGYNDCYAYRIW